jgi:hypothetical protein
MSIQPETMNQRFTRELHEHIRERLDKDFKLALPEFDMIDSKIEIDRDHISDRLLIRLDFLFEPNGLK